MTAIELDELLLHAGARGEVVLFTPAKLVPLRGEHRRDTWELISRPAPGEPLLDVDGSSGGRPVSPPLHRGSKRRIS